MNVPAHILKYCDELEAKVMDETAVLTASDLAKLYEIQSWYAEYLDQLEPAPVAWNLSDQMIEEIAARMQ